MSVVFDVPGLLLHLLNQTSIASSGLNASIPADSNFIIKELDRVAPPINVLLLLFISFMCEKPHSHAVLVAGSARVRSKTFKILGIPFQTFYLPVPRSDYQVPLKIFP